MTNKGLLILIGCLGMTLSACSPEVSSEVMDEVAQQVGDVMASIDEVGGPGGTLSQHQKSFLKMQNRLDPQFELPSLIPSAYAASCITSSAFSMCNTSTRTLLRTFDGCTLGLATFTGSVSLTWGGTGAGCSLGLTSFTGGTITRNPDFTVTGLRGASLKVGLDPSASIGQRITHVSGFGAGAQFKFSSDGIRRVFTLPDGRTLIDFTSKTISDLTLSGADRTSSRVLTGGVLRVKSNQDDFQCDFSPNQVTWSSSCTCPVSGSWEATCSDGSRSTIALNGCGSAEFTLGTETQTISFDRCVGI